MELRNLLLRTDGRIGRIAFWIGFAFLFLLQLPILGSAIGLFVALGSIYVAVCVWGKRLHDLGLTAKLSLVPILAPEIVHIAATVIAGVFTPSGFSEIYGGPWLYRSSDQAAQSIIQIGHVATLVIYCGMAIWLGSAPGQLGENRFGPDPRRPVEDDEDANPLVYPTTDL